MSDPISISRLQTLHIGGQENTTTQPQVSKGQDGGREITHLIKRFEEMTTKPATTVGPPTNKTSGSGPKERSVKLMSSENLQGIVSTSKGPQTTLEQTSTTYNYKEYVQKFGSKTANLYEIERLGVKVPERSPVSSKEIFDHLMTQDKENVIKNSWEAMQKNGQVDDVNLKAITDKIEEIFDEGFPFTKEQRDWIELTMADKIIIARSTGDEDSADTPNAGGNESVLFVKPTTESVSKAMKEVVLSYFGADSLRNRIVGDGMEKVLSGLPKMPVLLMEMIAEPIKDSKEDKGAPPPVGIAMSTDKVEFTGGEDFHFVSISSAIGPGVNEGNGRVEVDETFVMQSKDGTPLLIFQQPSIKQERIRAVQDDEKITNQLEKNSTEQAYSPSLSRDEIRSLVTSSDKIKSLNGGKTTEVEAVVGGDGQINFVQHRAIPDSRSKVAPTYVSTEQAKGHSQSFGYTTVVPKSGDALVITDWSEVCFAETMKEAEALFDWKGGTQKLVIVRQPDGSNSHPAVNFGSYKKDVNGTKEPNPIPCLVVPNYGELLALKKTALAPDQPLVIDGQTQKAYVWTDKTFDSATAIQDGRISHHIGLDTSVTDERIQELVGKLKTTKSDEISTLKTDLDPILKQYEEKLEKYEELLTKNSDTIHNSEGLKCQLKTTRENFQAVKEAFTQVLDGNPKYTFDEGTHARLLLVKFLESSMHGVDQFQGLIDAEKSATRYLQALKGSPVDKPVFGDQVLAVKDGLTGPLALRWKRVLTLAEQSGLSQTQISDFKNMMADLDKMGVRANWMSTAFDKKYAEIMPSGRSDTAVPKSKELLEALIKDYKDTAPFLVKQQALQKQLGEAERSVADFATPSKFDKSFSNLKSIAKTFIDEEWPKDLNENPLKKAVQIQTLGRLIEVYDSSIKTLKGSSLPTDQLVKAELEMLDTFSELFGSVFKKTDLPSGNPAPKQDYLDKLNEAYKTIKDNVSKSDPGKLDEQFRCGKNFNVVNCLYNNRGKTMPSNVEEMFTTLHQGLEDIRAGLMVGGSNYDIDLPKEMQSLLSTIPLLAMGTRIGKPGVLVGREITSDGVSYIYNMAVNDHGVKIKANYEKPTTDGAKGKLTLEVDFYADNTGDRLENMATLTKQLSFGAEPLDDSSRREVAWGENQFKAKFEVRSEKDLKTLSVYLTKLVQHSISMQSNTLAKVVRSNGNPTSGEIDKRRQRMMNDFLNVALGAVANKPAKGDPQTTPIIPTTDFKIQFEYAKSLSFNNSDDGVTYNLDLGKPDFGLKPDVFAKIPPNVLDEAKQAVLQGPSKFSFTRDSKTYSIDLTRSNLGLSDREIKGLGLNKKHLQGLRDDMSRALDKAVVDLVGKNGTNLSGTWPEHLYGAPMPYSKKDQPPELTLWKAASGGAKSRIDKLKSVDQAFTRTLNAKYALHEARAKLSESGTFASDNLAHAHREALKEYYRELQKVEYVCMGYVSGESNNQSKVGQLRKQTKIEKAAIETELQILGIKPEPLSSKEKSSLPFANLVNEDAWV